MLSAVLTGLMIHSAVATAYDLSPTSCGKDSTHPAYGLTASGYSLKGKSHRQAMTIAVDPRVIPLGTKVLVIIHDPKYKHLGGIYTARDTGRLIKKNRIDIFIGNDHKKALNFGVKDVTLAYIVDRPKG